MKKIKYPEKETWERLLKRPALHTTELVPAVMNILQDVRMNGDAAIRRCTSQFDGVDLSDLFVTEREMKNASQLVSQELKEAIAIAWKNITAFHNSQKEEIKKTETMPGVTCWRKSVPIEKVGLYIPGGSAPLFSTLLMLGIPAAIAGCREVVMCTPPNRNASVDPVILYVAGLLGIKKIVKAGGAQAIAALAYGTETIPAVDKIFGPGNQYVTCAKQLINSEGISIDIPAGPSELLVWADKSCVPGFVAADLLSQAEHGEDSQVILVSESEEVVDRVLQALEAQLQTLDRKKIAASALQNCRAIIVRNVSEAAELINRYAPEHLIIACEQPEELSMQIFNAGSVFLGNYSCESAGDYASGTNHTLPTNGFARAYSGVSLDSFVKKITYQQLTMEGLQRIGKAIETMAAAEGLQAHKNAVTIRMNAI